ncbi:MAG: hypothetical protein EHM12_11290 [Dehalococcoidia bacterium]|nr:MAG: hypothetical protein EHM12_11290 [Dehalococcoidia bacterium]
MKTIAECGLGEFVERNSCFYTGDTTPITGIVSKISDKTLRIKCCDKNILVDRETGRQKNTGKSIIIWRPYKK